MLPVVTADEMRALDRATIDDLGLPGMVLMETAGRAVADAAWTALAGRRHRTAAVVCGPGNNGGDGYVAARVLAERGAVVTTYLAAPRSAIRGDAAAHLAVLERTGGRVVAVTTPGELAAHRAAIESANVVVDALFGVGLARPIVGLHAALIAAMNASSGVRIAADIPSGVATDSGAVLGAAVVADVTITMAALKVALVSAPGFTFAGDVRVAEIGIPPPRLATSAAQAALVEAADIRAVLPAPHPLDHKGRRGHAIVVAGSPGKRGAARLAAHAALRAGAGLVTLAGWGDLGTEIAAPDPIMTELLIRPDALPALLAGKDAIAIGPGLITGAAGLALVEAALASSLPTVIDADGLNAIANAPARLADAAGPVVITPHPGEAGRLLATTAAAIESDRLAAARALAALTRAVVVLKGARTIVCDGRAGARFCTINPTGGPALATGGTGDVLAGTIAALLAQGLPAVDAARAAVYAHGLAGDRLLARLGRGATATDLADELAPTITSLLA
jgi:hydroxyethylthiazole kinase-like uncharacterized protein yjeF